MVSLKAPDKDAIRQAEDERILPLVTQAVRDVETAAELVGAFEDRLHQQVEWLETHADHPKYGERLALAMDSAGKHEGYLSALYRAGTDLHRRLDHLSAEGRRRAEGTHPGCTKGVDYARHVHYQFSAHAGKYYRLLEEGGIE